MPLVRTDCHEFYLLWPILQKSQRAKCRFLNTSADMGFNEISLYGKYFDSTYIVK